MIKPLSCRYVAEGTVANIAIQCDDQTTDTTGDWLFLGDDHRAEGSRVSPVFPDYAALIRWCHENSWAGIPGKAQVIKLPELGLL